MLSHTARTLALIISVILGTLVLTFGVIRFAYSPSEGHYTYNASPKLGGIAFPPFDFVLGKESQLQIAEIVRKHGMVGAALTITDFERNERPLIWWMVDKGKFGPFYKTFLDYQDGRKDRKEHGLPIFTSDEGLNRIVSRLLDGQHVCEPIAGTLIGKNIPEAAKTIERVCYAAIPPYGGAMTGYLTLFLPYGLSAPQLAEIRSSMIEVQLDIFNRDIRHIDVSNGLSPNDTPAPQAKDLEISGPQKRTTGGM